MDIDSFVVANQGRWMRLQELTKLARSNRSLQRLTPGDLDELLSLYQQCGTNLAHARVAYSGDTAVVSRLTLLVGDAHSLLYGQAGGEATRSIGRFVTETFPASILSLRRYIVAAALLTFIPWAVFQIWLAISPSAFDLVAPDAVKQAYITHDFESYYSSQPAQNFATQVFLNNVRIAFLAFAAGILLCVVTAALLAYNGAHGGMAGGMFTHVGESGKFWGLILPHGMLELSAVVVAGAAGLRIGWAIVDPGDRSRFEALTEESRNAGNVLIGLIAAFLLAALVEGFVTGQPWSTVIRIGIGAGVFLAFWGWTIVFGWRATESRRGTVQSRPEAFRSR